MLRLRTAAGNSDMQPFRVDFDLLEWQSPLPGARFKVFAADGKQLRLVEFTSEFVEPDWCEKGHVGVVLEGILGLQFRNGDTDISYQTGDGIFIPPGPTSAHKVRCVTSVVRLALVEDV